MSREYSPYTIDILKFSKYLKENKIEMNKPGIRFSYLLGFVTARNISTEL